MQITLRIARQQLSLRALLLIAGAALPEMAFAQGADPTLDLYPAKRNAAYTLDRPVTEEELAANYNNFYEFGTSKDVVASAKRCERSPSSSMVTISPGSTSRT